MSRNYQMFIYHVSEITNITYVLLIIYLYAAIITYFEIFFFAIYLILQF